MGIKTDIEIVNDILSDKDIVEVTGLVKEVLNDVQEGKRDSLIGRSKNLISVGKTTDGIVKSLRELATSVNKLQEKALSKSLSYSKLLIAFIKLKEAYDILEDSYGKELISLNILDSSIVKTVNEGIDKIRHILGVTDVDNLDITEEDADTIASEIGGRMQSVLNTVALNYVEDIEKKTGIVLQTDQVIITEENIAKIKESLINQALLKLKKSDDSETNTMLSDSESESEEKKIEDIPL